MSTNIDSFDLNAALLRKSATDLKAFLAALAARLEGALPGRVTVERRRDSLLSSNKHVVRILFDCDDALYAIALNRAGVDTTRAKKVRGVVISTVPVTPAAWLADVRAKVAALADNAGETSDILHDFL